MRPDYVHNFILTFFNSRTPRRQAEVTHYADPNCYRAAVESYLHSNNLPLNDADRVYVRKFGDPIIVQFAVSVKPAGRNVVPTEVRSLASAGPVEFVLTFLRDGTNYQTWITAPEFASAQAAVEWATRQHWWSSDITRVIARERKLDAYGITIFEIEETDREVSVEEVIG